MFLFVMCITILWLWTIVQKKQPNEFGKEKVFPLKGLLAVLIVLHHLTYEIKNPLLQPFHSWGAPIVSVFFFISGYGLMTSYKNKGEQYLSDFVKRRMFDAVILPFLLALLLYRCMATGLPNIADAISLLATKGITTLPNSWFVFAILYSYATFYLSCKKRRKNILSPLILSSIIYSIITCWLGYDRCWYISILAFPAGCVFACHWQAFLNSSFHWRNWVIPVCLAFVSVLYMLHHEVGYMFTYILIPLMVIYLCSSLNIERMGRLKVVKLLSEISYEIYLCHGIAMFLLNETLLIRATSGIYVLSVFLLTFIFAFIVKRTTKFLIAHGI